jgi:hypothetical protein
MSNVSTATTAERPLNIAMLDVRVPLEAAPVVQPLHRHPAVVEASIRQAPVEEVLASCVHRVNAAASTDTAEQEPNIAVKKYCLKS